MEHITYRQATQDDVEALTAMRMSFLAEAFGPETATPALRAALTDYFARSLPAGEFFAYLALHEDQIIATSGIVFHHRPPTPRNIRGITGYIMNMYTLPRWRHRGIAATLMQLLLSFASQRNCTCITLHALPAARHLYTGIGFMPSDDEMTIDLSDFGAGST